MQWQSFVKLLENDIDAIFGIAINENLGDSIIVTVIATGFEMPQEEEKPAFTQPASKTSTTS